MRIDTPKVGSRNTSEINHKSPLPIFAVTSKWIDVDVEQFPSVWFILPRNETASSLFNSNHDLQSKYFVNFEICLNKITILSNSVVYIRNDGTETNAGAGDFCSVPQLMRFFSIRCGQ